MSEYIKLAQIKKDIGLIQDSIFFELHNLNEKNEKLEQELEKLKAENKKLKEEIYEWSKYEP